MEKIIKVNASIKLFLDHKVGPSHGHRVWIGKLSKGDSINWFGVDFGACTLRISEKPGLIQVLRKSKHGNISNGKERFCSKLYFNAKEPYSSRYEGTGKARKAILELMQSS